MINDPELKAMSQVFDALESLDVNTQRRVVDWVLSKLESNSSGITTRSTKRGPKPGSKRTGKKRGRKPRSESAISLSSTTEAKRGPKPVTKVKGKPGRPPDSKNNATKSVAKPSSRRGRPRKTF